MAISSFFKKPAAGFFGKMTKCFFYRFQMLALAVSAAIASLFSLEERQFFDDSGPDCPKENGVNVGGQAVIEGVMMRGPERWAVTVRRSDGELETKEVKYSGWAKKRPLLAKPFIRGGIVLLESMVIGITALNFSAEIAARDEEPGKNEAGENALGPFSMAITIISAFALAMFLFVALPHLLSALVGRMWGFNESSAVFHIIDGFLKFSFFVAYIWGIGLIPDIGRVYAYHGAEHKAIYSFEAGEDLSPDNASKHPAWHPRCGTAFIFLVLAISIIFFAAIFPIFFKTESFSWLSTLAGIGLKVLLMMPLAGIAYEVTRKAGKAKNRSIWRILLWPGLLLQRMTTRTPDYAQLEVAIAALKRAVAPN